MKKTIITLISLLFVGSLSAQWQVIDDFEDGDVTNWAVDYDVQDTVQTTGTFTTVADPFGGDQGLVLAINPGLAGAGTYHVTSELMLPEALQIADPITTSKPVTFYFKIGRPTVSGAPGELDITFGLVTSADRPDGVDNSNRTTPDGTGVYSYGNYSVLGRYEIDGIMDIRDDGYQDLTTTALNTDVFYEVWYVVDHFTNTYSQYIKGGTDFPEQTLIYSNAAYRNQTFANLDHILMITSAGNTGAGAKGKDTAYFDDFYMDVSGVNLSSPDNQDGIGTKFVNVATRGLVGANPGEELIAGFVLLGDNPQQVLIRGLGPDLTDRGVSGVLADPTFIVRNFAGEEVASNDDWGNATDNADVAAAIAKVSNASSSALEDGSTDAAVLVTLAPNDVYTVVVSGKDGASGIALVEVFEVD